MISEPEKSQLKNLLGSPVWQTILKICDEYCLKVKGNSPIRESSDETLKELYLQEGKVEGVRNLIQEIFNSIS